MDQATGGELLDGKYEILKRLATGGMGEVYLVRHLHLEDLRVAKLLRPEIAADPAASRRFQREARLATQIKHPNVAILYDFAKLEDGGFYTVWEYIEGEDVRVWIEDRGPFAPSLAVELGVQALHGLDAIHAAGVIHRDVSPDNLMITRDVKGQYQVKIIDLGLAKDLAGTQEITQAGAFLGKLRYCSPEQAGHDKGRPLDHRSDLYSLALVLYEMLTGLPPFESHSEHGHVLRRLSEEPRALRARNPELDLPVSLEGVVMRSLERDRENRFADALSFARALESVAGELAEDARPRGEGGELANEDKRPDPTAVPSATRSTSAEGSGEMTAEERQDLLAQIDRAAQRVQATSRVFAEGEQALRDGRFADARRAVQQLEAANPRLQGLAELKRRLHEAEAVSRRRQQVAQTEQMLEKYLVERQQSLAALALETLLELYPNHPKRSDYEAWVKLLGDEVEQQKAAEKAYEAGRVALAGGDLAGARRHQEKVGKLDLSGELADKLEAQIREVDQSQRLTAEVEEVRSRLEELVAREEVEEATQELDRLATLGLPKVTLAHYRSRLAEIRSRLESAQVVEGFESRYQERIAAGDWFGAREVVLELEEAVPASSRPQEMFAEITRLEEVERRRRSLEEGLRTFEGYLGAGQLSQAELALKLLRSLAPDDPRVLQAGARLELERE